MSSTVARHYEAEAAIGNQMDENQMDEHMKAMWAGQSNILVSLRVRPIMKHDVVKKSCVRVLDGKVVVILDPMAEAKVNVLRVNRTREKQYAFDYVFEPSSSQEAIFHHTTKFLIHGVLDGYNATVFAYGQTGSGKTYTMIGTEENPGIMVRVMSDLFSVSASQAAANVLTYKVTVSFLEVYNENIRDLLSGENAMDDYLDLREDPIKGPMVAGITEVEAKNSGEIMRLLHQGNARRSQAATAANEVSSRSHAVLQVIVETRDSASGDGVVDNIKVGKLSLVDLAGSERAANTQNRGARLVEGANINRSLLALGNCINALGEKGNKGNFVPYRDSKLTRLLKDSLGGNCRTVMIANISAAESSFEETLNTLKYANRAKNIKTEAKRNVLNVNYHISEYVELINNLRGEIKVLKDQIETQGPGDELGGPGGDGGLGLGPAAAIAASEVRAKSRGSNMPFGLDMASINAPAAPGGGHSPASEHRVLNPSTPMQAVRDSLRSGGGHFAGNRNNSAQGGETRELVNSMRQMIVSNFQERMQLRRSLIELEDQNVQNSIEVSKRQLMVVQWTEKSGVAEEFGDDMDLNNADLSAAIIAKAPPDVATAWRECEQIRKAVAKNNSMKRSIAKRLRHNEREAERVRDELGDKITGEDRRELMELQYQVGRLELENMELEQHRIVHESILKGKDLVIQKLKLQLAVKEKIIGRQEAVLKENSLSDQVGYSQLSMFEQSLGMNDAEMNGAGGSPIGANTALYATQSNVGDSSPPRALGALGVGTYVGGMPNQNQNQQRGGAAGGGGRAGAGPMKQRHPKVPLLNDGGGLDTSLTSNEDALEMSGSQENYEDFTVEDPSRHVKQEAVEKREKERMSKEREAATMQQKKKEMADRRQAAQVQRAQREPPSSHHFFPGNGQGQQVAPERQGAIIKKNPAVRKGKAGGSGPSGGVKGSPRRNPAQALAASEVSDKERGSMGSGGLGIQGQGHGSGSGSGNLAPSRDSGGGSGNLLGPGPGPGGRGPRRPPNNYVPSSWESKQQDAADQQGADPMQVQQQLAHRGKNVSPIGHRGPLADGVNSVEADEPPKHVPTQPSGSVSSNNLNGGGKKQAYPNLYTHNNPPAALQPSRTNVNRAIQQAQAAAANAANAMNPNSNQPPPSVPQAHSIISADGYSEGMVFHQSPDSRAPRGSDVSEYDGESKEGGGGVRNSEMQRKFAAAGEGQAARPRRRPMGAAGARPKKGGMSEGEDGSVETIYSEDERSQSSLDRGDNGGGDRRSESKQQEKEATPADRAFAAAQAQVEAHRKNAAEGEQSKQAARGPPKMRARPRIRPLNKNAGAAPAGASPDGEMQQVLSPGGTSYQQILATASVSQAQKRAEGPAAALDRVRGLENSGVGGSPMQASGLGGMNRPNQPTRVRANPGGAVIRKRAQVPRSPEGYQNM